MLRYGSPHSIVQQPPVRRHTNRLNHHGIPSIFRAIHSISHVCEQNLPSLQA